jgi:hypothetical protein
VYSVIYDKLFVSGSHAWAGSRNKTLPFHRGLSLSHTPERSAAFRLFAIFLIALYYKQHKQESFWE